MANAGFRAVPHLQLGDIGRRMCLTSFVFTDLGWPWNAYQLTQQFSPSGSDAHEESNRAATQTEPPFHLIPTSIEARPLLPFSSSKNSSESPVCCGQICTGRCHEASGFKFGVEASLLYKALRTQGFGRVASVQDTLKLRMTKGPKPQANPKHPRPGAKRPLHRKPQDNCKA